ncbi:ankyrin repeat domain-containing protein [bacterium]|nr:ankyrin repeat domain-containing protein [bacterium]
MNFDIISVLKSALDQGKIEFARLLLDNSEIDPSIENNIVIRTASERGYYKVVKFLLSDIRVCPTALNNDAIFKAARGGYYDIVRLLLKDGRADPSDDNNKTIIAACENGHIKLVKLLLDYKPSANQGYVDPTDQHNEAIRCASEHGYSKIVKMLLDYIPREHMAKVDFEDNQAKWNHALELAIQCKRYNIIKLFLSNKKIDKNKYLKDAVHYHSGITKLFLEDPEIDPDGEILAAASFQGDIRRLKMLLNHHKLQAISDEDFNKAINKALSGGSYDILEFLVFHKLVPEYIYFDIEELEYACYLGHFYNVLFVLRNASYIREGNCCKEALMEACKEGHYRIVELLLSMTDVDPTTNNNEAIIAASGKDHHKVVKLLLDYKPKEGRKMIDRSDQYNEALIQASCGGYLEVVKLLVEYECSDSPWSGEVGNFKRASSKARRNGHKEIYDYLCWRY